MKHYTFYADPSHAWLAVPKEELIRLEILNQISSWSYQRGKTAYLEEDIDAGIFLKAFERKHLCFPKTQEKYTDYPSPIRSYQHF